MAVTSAPSQQQSDHVMGQHWPRIPEMCHLITACRPVLAPAEGAFAVAPRSVEAFLPRATARLATSLSCDSSLAKYVSEVLKGLSDAEAATKVAGGDSDGGEGTSASEPTSYHGLSPQGKRTSDGTFGGSCPLGSARRKSSRTTEGFCFPLPETCSRSGGAETTALGCSGRERRFTEGISPKAFLRSSLFASAECEQRDVSERRVGGGEGMAADEGGLERSPGGGFRVDLVFLREHGSGRAEDEHWERRRTRSHRLQRLNSAPTQESGGGGILRTANDAGKQVCGGMGRREQWQQETSRQWMNAQKAAKDATVQPPVQPGSYGAQAEGEATAPASSPGMAPEEEEQTRSKAPVVEPVQCKVAAMTCAGQKSGRKKLNQDAYCFMRSDCSRCLLFGVFDGHGPNGHDVAGYCKKKLPEELMKLPSLVPDPPTAFDAAFNTVNDCLLESNSSVSGTTAVMAQLHERRLTVAWVGDSRCVLASMDAFGSYRALSLTSDHKPDCVAERYRIEENNGRVDRSKNSGGEDVGPFRVWLGIAPILGLAMSRSLGDTLAHSVGVIATPEVVTRELGPEDCFMILATDGVWEWLTCEEAVRIVSSCPNLEAGCKKLVQAARQKWRAVGNGYVDDITAIVVEFSYQQ